MSKKRLYASHISLAMAGSENNAKSVYAESFVPHDLKEASVQEAVELRKTLRVSHFNLGDNSNPNDYYVSEMKRNYVPMDPKEARPNAIDSSHIRKSSIVLSSADSQMAQTDYQRNFHPFSPDEQRDAIQKSVELGLRESHIHLNSGGILPEDRMSVTRQDYVWHEVKDPSEIRYTYDDEDEE
ncbi:hypothetical protein J8273_2069 [Carpediemonas membranifera]|uniref:Uncharacterized protein n=1 Tax=Carpediemonas membranifera TaxID=201153 RepID=A0A8J6E3T1_9EUKA|nr:hypothetical protein J8273_2069 [Carpediemonas membranifera]|eukprot:KAG9396338.1 hypothetical protein J8273_2069 [Carpediemonas membranifera]